MANKITDEQLKTIVDQTQEYNGLAQTIGLMAIEKDKVIKRTKALAVTIEGTKKELEKEYGAVNIDLATGEYTLIETSEE